MDDALNRIREAYLRLEPPGYDTWNPLHDDAELWHRARLLVEACQALRRLPRPLADLRVLDVGCGVGRSSRLLIDLGVRPEHIVAIDLRESALAYARGLNPLVDYRHLVDLSAWPSGQFDLAVQCTVFSSIPSLEVRAQTAALMERSVGPAGHVLWWDSMSANDFAGGDELDPATLFAHRQILYDRRTPLPPISDESLRPLRGLRSLAARLLVPFGHRHTHHVVLFGPRTQGVPATPPAPNTVTGHAAPEIPPVPLPTTTRAAAAPVDHKDAIVHLASPRPASEVGLTLGSWQVFQHRPLLEIFARQFGQKVIQVGGALATVRKLPGLGAMRAQVYSPEAGAGADWSRALDALDVGELVVMTNQPAQPHWQRAQPDDLVSLVIDLRGGAEGLLDRFEQRARTASRRAQRAGVAIVQTRSMSDLDTVFEVIMRMSDQGRRFPVPSIGLLRTLLAEGHGRLYMATLGAQVIGGCVVLAHRYAHALVSGFDASACGGLPSTFMYAEVMRGEMGHGIPFLDFGPHSPRLHAGLILAKRAFNPLVVPAYRYEQPGAGWRGAAFSVARAARRSLRRE